MGQVSMYSGYGIQYESKWLDKKNFNINVLVGNNLQVADSFHNHPVDTRSMNLQGDLVSFT